MTKQQFDRVMKDTVRFNNREVAMSANYKKRWLVLGDNGQYWLVKPVNADRLVNAGYAYAV